MRGSLARSRCRPRIDGEDHRAPGRVTVGEEEGEEDTSPITMRRDESGKTFDTGFITLKTENVGGGDRLLTDFGEGSYQQPEGDHVGRLDGLPFQINHLARTLSVIGRATWIPMSVVLSSSPEEETAGTRPSRKAHSI